MGRGGFRGISYPFRITSRGGVAMSEANFEDSSHIAESIQQIFNTNFLERPMEGNWVYTQVTSSLFEPNDESLQQVLKTYIVEDLTRLEERIRISEDDITFSVEEENGVEVLYALITYQVIKYNTTYTSKIRVGNINE